MTADLPAQLDEMLRRGSEWLFAQQAKDGGWHSETYGAHKGGAAITALVLYAASHLPDDLLSPERLKALQRGMEFLLPGIEKKGCVACPDGTLDEPNYGTALLLLATLQEKFPLPQQAWDRLMQFLLDEQCAESRGFKPDDPDYGGWDLAGGSGLRGETPGTNVSITRLAVQAVQNAEDVNPQLLATSLRLAREWIARVQNLPGDGGFFFHPERGHEGNKAQWADETKHHKPRSYGTATCDGLLLLMDFNSRGEMETRLSGASKWLLRHATWDVVPGFEDAPQELGWREGLLFYYWMVRAHASVWISPDDSAECGKQISAQLQKRQQADGHWQNESARMREDDPLIATCFALTALGTLRDLKPGR